MYVIVLKDDGSYYITKAVAVHYDGWKTEYFLINEDDEYFERVFEYSKNSGGKVEKRVFLYDADIDDDDFISDGSYEGYSRFVNDKKMLDRIRNGEKNIFDNETMWAYRGFITDSIDNNIVDDAHSCKVLYNFAGGFHDAVVKEYYYDENNNSLKIILEGVWGVEKLTLTFEEVVKFNIEEYYDTNYFSEGSLFYEDNNVCFVNDECNCKKDICEEWTFVYSKRLKYDIIFEKHKTS